MIGIPVGLAVANMAEWVFHRHIQHGFGKKVGSYWSFHWLEHHPEASKANFYDKGYERSLFGWHAQSKEALGLAGAAIVVTPLFPIAPFMTLALQYSAFNYYRKHKRAHLDVEWGKKNLPWHYDHHMSNPNANYCVTKPWFDYVMKTCE